MSETTAVQLKDGAGVLLQDQYYDSASDSYKPGDPSIAGIGMLGTVATTAPADSLVLRAGPCKLFGVNVCGTTAAGYLMLFNAAAAPANGAVTPAKVWPVAINTGLEIGFDQPIQMSVGAVLAFSTTGPFTLTRSVTAFLSGEVA